MAPKRATYGPRGLRRATFRAAFERDGKKARNGPSNGHLPNIHRLTSTLYSHFIEIQTFDGSFDLCLLYTSPSPRDS